MKAVYITAGFAIVGLCTWLSVILINGVRRRINVVTEAKRRRAEKERERKANGW